MVLPIRINSKIQEFLLITLGWLCVIVASDRVYGGEYGSFSGDPKLMMVGDGDGDEFRVISDFEYYDPEGRTWRVSEGALTNGASIPRPFWSFIGHPFGGSYRYAAVVHDYFCNKRFPNYELVHQTFLKGMLAKGVSPGKAWIMFEAVVMFGPRWDRKSVPAECSEGPRFKPSACVFNEGDGPVTTLAPMYELNKVNLGALIKKAEARGYKAEAMELLQQPDLREILQR